MQEGILGAQKIPGNCQLALDKQTDTLILTPIIAQEGANEKLIKREGHFIEISLTIYILGPHPKLQGHSQALMQPCPKGARGAPCLVPLSLYQVLGNLDWMQFPAGKVNSRVSQLLFC